MTEPTVTVLTPTYNRAALLPRLHDSLMRQTYQGFEWLVVDDGSTDDTARVIERLSERSTFEVRYVHQPNRGKHAALNIGVADARGRYLAVIDSDDWYDPEALSVLTSAWGALLSPDDFAEVQGLCATAEGQIIGSPFPCAEQMDSDAFEIFFRHRVRGDKTGMIRTDVMREFRFPEELGGFVTESLVWHRIARTYRTRYVNRVLAHKDYQPEGLSRRRPHQVVAQARMYHLFFKEIVQMPRAMPPKERYRAYANWVRNGLLARQPIRADLREAPSRVLFLLGVPAGFSLAVLDRRRMSRHPPPATRTIEANSSSGSAVTLRDVSVIVVLHNSGEVIAECLASLPREVEVVVVDNASADDGGRVAASARREIKLVTSGSNSGFGGGCQLGAEAASRELLLFLNPDARTDSASILRLARTLADHPYGIVGPRLLTATGTARPIRRELDIRHDVLWLLPFAGRWLPDRWRPQRELDRKTEYEVAFVEGACFLVRRNDLATVGGFDPDLFLYFEEASLAYRLKQRGGAAWYEPRASATHIGETSTGKRTVFATHHFYRSRVIYERKVFGDAVGRLHAMALLLAASISVLRAVVHRILPSWPNTVLQSVAVVRGTIAGSREPLDSRYR